MSGPKFLWRDAEMMKHKASCGFNFARGCDCGYTPDQVDALLDDFFILRAATPDVPLEEIKLRNELGEPKAELKAKLSALLVEARIDELKGLPVSSDIKTEIAIENRITELSEELEKQREVTE
jgi:hypothetical protein